MPVAQVGRKADYEKDRGHSRPVQFKRFGVIATIFGGEAANCRTDFCISCHSGIYPHEEQKKFSYWGALEIDPGCKDCHVPQGLGD
jgi:hypothetical protein